MDPGSPSGPGGPGNPLGPVGKEVNWFVSLQLGPRRASKTKSERSFSCSDFPRCLNLSHHEKAPQNICGHGAHPGLCATWGWLCNHTALSPNTLGASWSTYKHPSQCKRTDHTCQLLPAALRSHPHLISAPSLRTQTCWPVRVEDRARMPSLGQTCHAPASASQRLP